MTLILTDLSSNLSYMDLLPLVQFYFTWPPPKTIITTPPKSADLSSLLRCSSRLRISKPTGKMASWNSRRMSP